MNRTLEDITVEEFWQLFMMGNPPPKDTTSEQISVAREFFVAGFGTMLKLTERLQTETPARQQNILALLEKQLTGCAS